MSRVRGPFKSKKLAGALGLAILLVGFVGHCLPKLAQNRYIQRKLSLDDWFSTPAGIAGVFVGLALAALPFLVISFWEKVKARAELLSRSLKAPSGDEVLKRDRRPPILYLRSFADDTGLYPDHEQELVAALSQFGPVIAIGRPGESLQTLGAARVYVGDDWQEQIRQRIEASALVVLRIGESGGLRWEIETVATNCSPQKILLQVPQSLSRNAAVLLDKLVGIITRRRSKHDYNNVSYVYFDNYSHARLLEGTLRVPKVFATDAQNLQLYEFYEQMFSDEFIAFFEQKRRAARSRRFRMRILTYLMFLLVFLLLGASVILALMEGSHTTR